MLSTLFESAYNRSRLKRMPRRKQRKRLAQPILQSESLEERYVLSSAPIALDSSVGTYSDETLTFQESDFRYSDDDGDALASVVISNLSLNSGSLTLSGVNVVNGDSINASDLTNLVYTPLSSLAGSYTAGSFAFVANDDDDSGTESAVMTIFIYGENEAPSIIAPTVEATIDASAVTFSSTNSNAITIADGDYGAQDFYAPLLLPSIPDLQVVQNDDFFTEDQYETEFVPLGLSNDAVNIRGGFLNHHDAVSVGQVEEDVKDDVRGALNYAIQSGLLNVFSEPDTLAANYTGYLLLDIESNVGMQNWWNDMSGADLELDAQGNVVANDVLEAYFDAYKWRLEVLKEFFPNAKVVVYGMPIQIWTNPASSVDIADIPNGIQSEEDIDDEIGGVDERAYILSLAIEHGVFEGDGVNGGAYALSPRIYQGWGPGDFRWGMDRIEDNVQVTIDGAAEAIARARDNSGMGMNLEVVPLMSFTIESTLSDYEDGNGTQYRLETPDDDDIGRYAVPMPQGYVEQLTIIDEIVESAINSNPAADTAEAIKANMPAVMTWTTGSNQSMEFTDFADQSIVEVKITPEHGTIEIPAAEAADAAYGNYLSLEAPAAAGGPWILRASLDRVNEALEGMVFHPDEGFIGDATIEIDVDDYGGITGEEFNVPTHVITIDVGIEFVVDTLDDLQDADLGDGVAEASNGLTSLRSAVQEANALGAAARIILPEGQYALTLTGSDLGNARVNDLDITSDVTIVGAGAGLSVIEANFSSVDAHTRIFDVLDGGSLTAADLTITGGNTTGSGGGIQLVEGGELDLERVAIVDNRANDHGGGIVVLANSAMTATTISVIDSVITENSAGHSGGGLLASGTLVTLDVGGTIIAGNTSAETLPDRSDYHISYVAGVSDVTLNDQGNNLLGVVGSPQPFTASSNTYGGTPDYIVTSVADRVDSSDDDYAYSLREAVIDANGSDGTIWLPSWDHQLTRSGSEASNATTNNDLDITGDVTIVGAGAGLSVIEANFSSVDAHTRIFDVLDGGSLTAADLTITGGNTTGSGGGIQLVEGGELDLERVAIVDNRANDHGGGIVVLANSAMTATTISVIDSVITENSAGHSGGGLLASGTLVTLDVGGTIIAGNTSAETLPDRSDYHISYVAGVSDVTLNDQGNNLLGVVGSPQPFTASSNTYGGTPDYIVTSVVDRIDSSDDDYALSLREAVIAANTASGTDEIWLPAWTFVLTRDRQTYGGGSETDIDASFGDLDIKESLIIRGVANETSVAWRAGVTDAVFDLLGDYNEDGEVEQDIDAADYTVWADTDGSGTGTEEDWEEYAADGDDDGDVDQDDYDIWEDYYGNSLDLINLT